METLTHVKSYTLRFLFGYLVTQCCINICYWVKLLIHYSFSLLIDYFTVCCVLTFQVMVRYWVNGHEGKTLEGVNARFGSSLPIDVKRAPKWPAVFLDPLNGCSASSSKVFSLFFLVHLFLLFHMLANFVSI